MAKLVLKNVKLYLNGYDLSCDHNSVSFGYSANEVEATVFCDDAVRRLAGLPSFEITHNGYVDTATDGSDSVLFPLVGSTGNIMTLSATGANAGDIASFSKGVEFEYSPSGNVGDMFSFTSVLRSEGEKLVRGVILHNDNESASGNGSALNIGSVGSSQKLYAALHVISAGSSGPPTLDVKIQSDDNDSFTSPTDRIMFSTFTTSVGAEWATPVSGAITDTYWRATWTISGDAYEFIVVMGIL